MKPFVPILPVSFFILTFCLLCTRCRQKEDHPSVLLVSKNGKAVALTIRGSFVNNEDVAKHLVVRLIKSGERLPVLGDFRRDADEIIFEPVVPLTKGLRYEVLLHDTLISEIEVAVGEAEAPALVAIYPSQDTLPENLLKFYFEFSEPMVEGSSLAHVILVHNDDDTLRGTFLDLQPELWSSDATILTLWLDPGRIKRDLIPNQELGNPLNKGERYTLHVDKSWESQKGVLLSKSYAKTFVTTGRDEESPILKRWELSVPASDTNDTLEIKFPQPLDYFLVKECISIFDSDGNMRSGTMVVADEEKVARFVPDSPWTKGRFHLKVETRLEDLAGNNLERPFETYVGRTETSQVNNGQRVLTKEFIIE